ncbi:hypothetical protein BDY17DRAFT_302449 [Neohortaea acidophila]|uniref:Uncharacterized protein n=1 Tax=Neohortaea acidophila TaxID=245834 RepID=A0A6A6PL66_9PEZI|nr:uncharacterized protein BDY17DRAFT_302449 [Neohortaea acidophila]KAF2480818.1 hypothetical protein BDY17DRAFT_302449 [Neohortaea acidophila]
MSLSKSLPWTKSPLIINAPMGGFATAKLSTAVSQAGGVGLIGDDSNMPALADTLAEVDKALSRTDAGLLPVGVGLLLFLVRLDEALPLLEKYRPAIVWMFAAKELAHYADWAARIRAALPKSQIWIQVGSVHAAMEVAATAKPDVMCVQGSDAGGHGYEKGAGFISLLPEISDALAANGHNGISLVAAGGIVDGRSAAAAFALGAQGVVMGTRFLSARETNVHPVYQEALVAASDGGQSTRRSKLFDNLRGPNIWPGAYDGRSILMQSWADHESGVGIEEIRKRHKEALKDDDKGFNADRSGRAVMWAGTGVGLVKKVQPAAEIVEEVRSTAAARLKEVASKL